MSDYTLSDTERFVLAHGFGFSIPNNNIKREEVFAEFELLYEQLSKHYAVSIEADQAMKARLCDLAYAYDGTPNDLSDSYLQRECMTAMKNLRRKPEIHICKPDKGSGVVILNQVDYLNKNAGYSTGSVQVSTAGKHGYT